MKQTEDDTFLFKFSFIETDHEKGFVTHYRPSIRRCRQNSRASSATLGSGSSRIALSSNLSSASIAR